MKLDEVMEMSYPRKYVEHIVIGLEEPLNQHLVKLAAFDFPPEERRHFRSELRSWLDKIQRLRLKPRNQTGTARFYYDLLYDYPFGGVEVRNMRTMMTLIEEESGLRPARSPEEAVEWLRRFHERLAERLHKGEAVLDLVPE